MQEALPLAAILSINSKDVRPDQGEPREAKGGHRYLHLADDPDFLLLAARTRHIV